MTPDKEQAITPTWRQVRQYEKFVEDGAYKARRSIPLSSAQMQNLFTRGNIFQRGMINLIKETAEYQDPKPVIYPVGFKVKSLEEQFEIYERISKLKDSDFKGLELPSRAQLTNLPPLPKRAEGWLLFPKSRALESNYSRSLSILKSTRPFSFYERITEGLQLRNKTDLAFQNLNFSQKDQWLVIPVQFGQNATNLNHSYGEPEDYKNLGKNEFFLDLHTIIWMLITHPERIINSDEIMMICGGNINPDDGGIYLSFYFQDLGLNLSKESAILHTWCVPTGFLV